jgi:hypothetical protein
MCDPNENVFRPTGQGYDYANARRAGFKPGDDGHWPSRMPLSPEEAASAGLPADSGLLLKGSTHPTFQKGVDVDKSLGYRLVSRGGRFYTVKD